MLAHPPHPAALPAIPPVPALELQELLTDQGAKAPEPPKDTLSDHIKEFPLKLQWGPTKGKSAAPLVTKSSKQRQDEILAKIVMVQIYMDAIH